MDAGKFDTRVEIKTLTKTSDGYGGATSTLSAYSTIWANVREVDGDVETSGYKRGRVSSLNIFVRKKTAEGNNINQDVILRIQGKTDDYRVVSISDDTHKKIVKIRAEKTF